MLVFIRLQGPIWNICSSPRYQYSDSLDTEMYSIPLSLSGFFYFLAVGIGAGKLFAVGVVPSQAITAFLFCAYHWLWHPAHFPSCVGQKSLTVATCFLDRWECEASQREAYQNLLAERHRLHEMLKLFRQLFRPVSPLICSACCQPHAFVPPLCPLHCLFSMCLCLDKDRG